MLINNIKEIVKMKRHEVYDCNKEVIDEADDIYEALGCAEAYEAQFIYDAHTHRIIWGYGK